MKFKPAVFFAAAFAVLLFSHLTFANNRENAETLARQAVAANSAEATAAVAELRAMGASGLKTLFEIYQTEIAEQLAEGDGGADWAKIAAALDAVAMQKNSYAAGLYWHTDLNSAKKTAAKENKPILSLRLLGNLNEEFSCANSRFFRTILYADTNIAKTLREKYVLHWQSVRPAPRVTIDFGDGRKIERTITGNSIHYILDETGAPLDALPGLYSPQAFQSWLIQNKNFSVNWQKLPENRRQVVLREYHRNKLTVLANAWREDLSKVKQPPTQPSPVETGNMFGSKNPSAVRAMPLAVSKMVVEVDILRSITADINFLRAETSIEEWREIANMHIKNVQLSQNSIRLIQRQLNEKLPESARLVKVLARLRDSIALDTVRNDYLLNTKLNEWFMRGEVSNLEKLNERVYDQLFLTPRSDEWLGLYSPDVYTALDNNGIK